MIVDIPKGLEKEMWRFLQAIKDELKKLSERIDKLEQK